MMPLRKMRSRSLAVVELVVLSLIASNIWGTETGTHTQSGEAVTYQSQFKYTCTETVGLVRYLQHIFNTILKIGFINFKTHYYKRTLVMEVQIVTVDPHTQFTAQSSLYFK